MELNRQDDAIISYENSARFNPIAEAYLCLGMSLDRVGRKEEAQQQYLVAREKYEDRNGLVTVHYDPNKPSRSTLQPGRVGFTDFYGALFVSGLLIVWFLWLMVQPYKILKWRKSPARTS